MGSFYKSLMLSCSWQLGGTSNITVAAVQLQSWELPKTNLAALEQAPKKWNHLTDLEVASVMEQLRLDVKSNESKQVDSEKASIYPPGVEGVTTLWVAVVKVDVDLVKSLLLRAKGEMSEDEFSSYVTKPGVGWNLYRLNDGAKVIEVDEKELTPLEVLLDNYRYHIDMYRQSRGDGKFTLHKSGKERLQGYDKILALLLEAGANKNGQHDSEIRHIKKCWDGKNLLLTTTDIAKQLWLPSCFPIYSALFLAYAHHSERTASPLTTEAEEPDAEEPDGTS